MAIIRKGLPNSAHGNYTKLDNAVFRIRGMSDGAKVLYGFLASLKSGEEFNDHFVMEGLQISQKTLTSRKRELKDAGLILVEKIGLRGYVMYIGYVDFNAYKVKEHWAYVHSKANEGVDMATLKAETREAALANNEK